jgi:hypothetical protein
MHRCTYDKGVNLGGYGGVKAFQKQKAPPLWRISSSTKTNPSVIKRISFPIWRYLKLFGMFLGMYKSKKPLRAYIDYVAGGDERFHYVESSCVNQSL